MTRVARSRGRATAPLNRPLLRYRAFGLALASELELDELSGGHADDPVDLTIRLLPNDHVSELNEAPVSFRLGATECVMAWEAVGRFRVVADHTVEIARTPGASDALLRFPLLGPVMAMVLQQRGMFVLHASAVAIGNVGAVFLGDKMAGKSTIAAAFVAAGHRLLTDDVLAIDFSPSGDPVIRPSFPQLKLDEASSRSVLGDHAIPLPVVLSDIPKRQHKLKVAFDHSSVRPSRFYVLKRGRVARATALASQDAFKALMRYSYSIRFPTQALAGAAAATHFRQSAALADRAAVAELEVPTGLHDLMDVVRLVEKGFS